MWILLSRSNCSLCGKDLNLKQGLLYYVEFHLVDKSNVVQTRHEANIKKQKKV